MLTRLWQEINVKQEIKTYIRHGKSNKDELTPSHPRVVAIKYCQEYIKFKINCGAEREVKKLSLASKVQFICWSTKAVIAWIDKKPSHFVMTQQCWGEL